MFLLVAFPKLHRLRWHPLQLFTERSSVQLITPNLCVPSKASLCLPCSSCSFTKLFGLLMQPRNLHENRISMPPVARLICMRAVCDFQPLFFHGSVSVGFLCRPGAPRAVQHYSTLGCACTQSLLCVLSVRALGQTLPQCATIVRDGGVSPVYSMPSL